MKRRKLAELVSHSKFISAVAMAAAVLVAFIGWREITTYENSILSVYAEQQDAYVQLVLDQINILDNRSDEEIVTKILGSLDTSGRKYWTLTKDQALLFVKDVTETNRYRGLTTESFFSGESAAAFLKELTVNQVVHKIIQIDQDRYVASGVIFEYNGAEYTICLLTNETVVLDNNAFLSSKIGLYIFVYGILGVFLIVVMLGVALLDDRGQKICALQEHTRQLNRIVEEQTEKIKAMDYYHTRWSLYELRLMDVFVRKLEKRQIAPVAFVELSFQDSDHRREFLRKAQLLLDEKILRFRVEDGRVLLIFIQYSPEEARGALSRLPGGEKLFRVGRTAGGSEDDQPLWETYQAFRADVQEPRETKTKDVPEP